MSLPIRLYFPIHKAAKILECEFDDLVHYAAQERLELCLKVSSASPVCDENGQAASASLVSSFEIENIVADDEVHQDYQALAEKLFPAYVEQHADRREQLTCGVYRSRYVNFAELYDIEKRRSVMYTFAGLFSIDTTFIQQNEIKIINDDIQQILVNELRFPRCEYESTRFYTLDHLEFDRPIVANVSELLISTDEIELLKKGGKKLFTSSLVSLGKSYDGYDFD